MDQVERMIAFPGQPQRKVPHPVGSFDCRQQEIFASHELRNPIGRAAEVGHGQVFHPAAALSEIGYRFEVMLPARAGFVEMNPVGFIQAADNGLMPYRIAAEDRLASAKSGKEIGAVGGNAMHKEISMPRPTGPAP